MWHSNILYVPLIAITVPLIFSQPDHRLSVQSVQILTRLLLAVLPQALQAHDYTCASKIMTASLQLQCEESDNTNLSLKVCITIANNLI